MQTNVLFWVLLLAAPIFGSGTASATIPTTNPDACREGPLNQFGRYLGTWQIADESLSQDGKTWTPGKGAVWTFVCIGDGTAVQDFWLPRGGPVGTNLRTFNPETEAWDIVWAVKPQPGLAQINAKLQPDGSIEMRYLDTTRVPMRRITFYPPTAEGWKWKLEFSQDKGATWREVYRISASR